jgi:hypothetical protein
MEADTHCSSYRATVHRPARGPTSVSARRAAFGFPSCRARPDAAGHHRPIVGILRPAITHPCRVHPSSRERLDAAMHASSHVLMSLSASRRPFVIVLSLRPMYRELSRPPARPACLLERRVLVTGSSVILHSGSRWSMPVLQPYPSTAMERQIALKSGPTVPHSGRQKKSAWGPLVARRFRVHQME